MRFGTHFCEITPYILRNTIVGLVHSLGYSINAQAFGPRHLDLVAWLATSCARGWAILWWIIGFMISMLHCCCVNYMFVLDKRNTAWLRDTVSQTSEGSQRPQDVCLTVSRNHAVFLLYTYMHACMHACIHTYIHTYLLLLISMLWHREAIFESKGDKLSSSAECRIRTQRISETQSSADWMPADKPTELSRIKLKIWTRQPVPMISKHSAHLTPTAIWHSHLALAINIFVVVNFDALAQGSDFRIERRQIVFLCWMQDSNPEGLWNPIFSRLNTCWQTDWHWCFPVTQWHKWNTEYVITYFEISYVRHTENII